MLEYINSSALTKLLAILFIFMSLIVALVVVTVDLLVTKTEPPQYVYYFIFIGLGASIKTLGVNLGVSSVSALSQLPIAKAPGADNAQKS